MDLIGNLVEFNSSVSGLDAEISIAIGCVDFGGFCEVDEEVVERVEDDKKLDSLVELSDMRCGDEIRSDAIRSDEIGSDAIASS